MPHQSDTAQRDAAVAAIASRQHGVVTAAQLRDAGIARSSIQDRLRSGRLHRLHRGVYAVGHAALSSEGAWMGAVLACAGGAVLSHRSAAEHWGMLRPAGGPVHVIVPGTVAHRRRGVVAHRSRTLLPSQATVRAHIPVTKPARTLIDLRRIVPGDFRRALRQAEFLGLPVADVVSDGTGTTFEAAFLALCRRHRLSKPLVNTNLGPYEVDFLWPVEKLVVETDGWQGHRGRVAFQEDRERDLYLKVRGYEVLRLTYEQVTKRPAPVAAAIGKLLARRRRGVA